MLNYQGTHTTLQIDNTSRLHGNNMNITCKVNIWNGKKIHSEVRKMTGSWSSASLEADVQWGRAASYNERVLYMKRTSNRKRWRHMGARKVNCRLINLARSNPRRENPRWVRVLVYLEHDIKPHVRKIRKRKKVTLNLVKSYFIKAKQNLQ